MPASRKTTRTTRKPRRAPAARPVPVAGTKLDLIVGELNRPEGASLAELVAATGWQPHSVRGALAGSIRKKGHVIVSEKIDGERRYRIGEIG